MASLSVSAEAEALPYIKPKKNDTLLIQFITPADFNGNMFPENFNEIKKNDQTVWQGEINGISLQIEAAVIGKAHREGGWDMQKHQPRSVKSYTPAGTAWFCRLNNPDDYQQVHDTLQGYCIGEDSAYGRGQILIGQWQDAD